jgi:hypothetical protein
MNRRGIGIAIAGLVALVAVVAILVLSRERIAHRSYARSGKSLVAKLSTAQEKKYGTDLRYTLDTFWKFYDKKLVSRNDLNDVMDKMRALRAKKEITDTDIFDYITYVSTLYTEAMRRRQSEMFPE